MLNDKLINEIKSNIERIGKKIRIIEVCGTHTVSIYKNGFHTLFKDYIEFISGPGCPVCVTHEGYIDELIRLSNEWTIYTFGDLLKVPGRRFSLSQARANGAKIKVIYSPVDAVESISKDERVIFATVGFETTAPIFALAVERAIEKKLKNVKFACELKTIDEPLKVLFQNHLQVDGIILPGHVASILGVEGFRFVEKFNIPSVISGFEGYDILLSIVSIINDILNKDFTVKNEYKRVVKNEGNVIAKNYINKFFERGDSYFRGLGLVKGGGFKIKKEFEDYSIELSYNHEEEASNGCKCAQVLTGKIKPYECPLFEKICSPLTPKGACMVSQEGSCNAYFKYGKWF